MQLKWILLQRIGKRYKHIKSCDNNLLDRLIMLEYLISNKILKCIDKHEKYKYYCENIKKVNIINNLRYSNKVINYCNDIMEYMIKDIEKNRQYSYLKDI